MVKNYVDELAAWTKKRQTKPRFKDKNQVAFLAVRNDVKAAMDAGYALKTIWEHMHETGKIGVRYEAFLKYVHKHITKKGTPPKDMSDTSPNETTQAIETKQTQKESEKKRHPVTGDNATGEQQKASPQKMKGFNFNASAKKEDLI